MGIFFTKQQNNLEQSKQGFQNRLKYFFYLSGLVFLLVIMIFLSPFIYFNIFYADLLGAKTTTASTAIVFGAGAFPDHPTQVLQDRLDRALELYNEHRVQNILVTGDNSDAHYNEPRVMKNYLLDRGVKDADIYSDFAGLRTYDSCWRAKHVYKLNFVYLVSQDWHLPRANYLCTMTGLHTILAPAKSRSGHVTISGVYREFSADWLAIYDVATGTSSKFGSDGSEVIP